jgi:hypothetical protein
MVGHRPLGNDGPVHTVQEKLDYFGTFATEHRHSGEEDDKLSVTRALLALGANSSLRAQPHGYPNYGFGRMSLPKGIVHSDTGFVYSAPLLGIDIVGVNAMSSAITSNSTTGYGFKLAGYDLVSLSGFYLRNIARDGHPLAGDTSSGLLLETGAGTNGGGRSR